MKEVKLEPNERLRIVLSSHILECVFYDFEKESNLLVRTKGNGSLETTIKPILENEFSIKIPKK
jgi:hypothetical protein